VSAGDAKAYVEAHFAAKAKPSGPTSQAASGGSGPADFVIEATTEKGDKVKVEGRFGPPQAAAESDVSQGALGECPSPASDGRELIVRLDMVTRVSEFWPDLQEFRR